MNTTFHSRPTARTKWVCFTPMLVILTATLPCPCVAATGGLRWADTELVVRLQQGAKDVTAEFRFRNSGPKSVNIVSVASSCDCLTTKIAAPCYAPGESGVILAEFDAAGREGRQERTITVATDDVQSPTVLKLIVDLPEPVVLKPRFLFWRVGEFASEKEIEVTLAEPIKAALDDVVSSNPAFRAALIAGERSGHYRVKIAPASTAQIAQTTVRLSATVDGQPRVFVLYAAVK